jgi:hypothetical protein
MLDESYTLGTGANELTFSKHYGDAQAGSYYSVAGLPAGETKSLAVQSQLDKAKSRRTLIDTKVNVAVPGTTTGAFGTARCYCNFVELSYQDRATTLAMAERMASLLSDTAALNAILDGQR